MTKTCVGTFDGDNRGLPCDYVFCPDEEVLYCNFCLQDEPPKPEPEVPKLATTPPKTKSDSSASSSASTST
ncbi:hypothetical protein CspHIS471_0109320 [Cutaneotrichosporon sp. HIS471]|nr:hypothetical protein CspHIS471_0109320 [Cutaneotrichosporon sp. HIS471]